jgi:hypothetical protein
MVEPMFRDPESKPELCIMLFWSSKDGEFVAHVVHPDNFRGLSALGTSHWRALQELSVVVRAVEEK